MSDKIKVISGSDFRDRWNGWYITLEDYENISIYSYDQELYNIFEYYSFEFDEEKHECVEIW